MPEATLAGAPGDTLAEALHRTLLDALLFGRFAQGARILPAEIATAYGVSYTPAREALSRLAAEGYLIAIPRRGFRVRVPGAAEIRDLWHVRLALEIAAGERAIERLTADPAFVADIEALAAIQDRIEGKVSHRAHIALNAEFHDRLIALSGNRLLASTYRAIGAQLFGAWIQRGTSDWRRRLPAEAREHRAIIAALFARDAVAFRAALTRHLDRSANDAVGDSTRREPSGGTP